MEKINLPELLSDLGGRVLEIDENLSITLTEKGKLKHIGKLIAEPDGSVSYYKAEREENIFRKYNAWSVLEVIADRVDKVIYETDTTVYSISADRFMGLQRWGGYDLERKIIIPLDLWRKDYKDGKTKRRLELFGHEWYGLLREHIDSPWFAEIGKKVAQRRTETTVFPDKDKVFRVFGLSPVNMKVVVIGQDPYYNGLADGLAFSSNDPSVVPESLKNIFKEIEKSHDTLILDPDPRLDRWHQQGVFLMNTCLTVDAGVPLSHSKFGWERFTIEVIKTINTFDRPIVHLLWGNNARKYKQYLDNPNHLVLESVHPSPLSAHRGFFGNNHFVDANVFLKSKGIKPIDWI